MSEDTPDITAFGSNVTVIPSTGTGDPFDQLDDYPIAPAIPVEDAIDETVAALLGHPVFLAGSAVTARAHGLKQYGDIDLFVPTQQVLISTIQLLLSQGYTLDDRFERVWHRWLRYGMKGWHTNSMRLHSKTDVQINVVYKLTDRHPTASLAQVLESFDFGLLGVGIDVETATIRDMRSYLFPDSNINGPLPLMPAKRDTWRHGFISQYNGLREAARYAKYHGYGYDMSAVKDDLVTGYDMAAVYHMQRYDSDKQLLGEIYAKLSERIGNDEIDELATAYLTLDFNDELDKIMEGLE
jgi:hypothetical protein